MDWEVVSKELRKPLDPKHIKPAPKGKFGDYLEGYHVITEANRIFGFNGWSYVITSLDQVSRVEAKDRDGQPQVRVAWKCTVRLTTDEGKSVKEGAAVGTGMAKPENEGDAHESAIKEAETDALKRALRTYGNPFGLALYDKTKSQVGVERDPDQIATMLEGAIQKAGTLKDLDALNKSAKFDAAMKWLADEHPDYAARVLDKMNAHEAQLIATQAAAE